MRIPRLQQSNSNKAEKGLILATSKILVMPKQIKFQKSANAVPPKMLSLNPFGGRRISRESAP
jgi:hypothetical protein